MKHKGPTSLKQAKVMRKKQGAEPKVEPKTEKGRPAEDKSPRVSKVLKKPHSTEQKTETAQAETEAGTV